VAVNRASVPAHLHARYGIGPARPWLRVALSAVGIALVGGLLFAVSRPLAHPTDTTLINWKVDGETVALAWSVERVDDASVICVVRAQDADHYDVGYALVRIQHTAGRPGFHSVLHTRGTAYAVPVPECAQESQMRAAGPHFRPGLLPPAQTDGLAAPWQPLPEWLNA